MMGRQVVALYSEFEQISRGELGEEDASRVRRSIESLRYGAGWKRLKLATSVAHRDM